MIGAAIVVALVVAAAAIRWDLRRPYRPDPRRASIDLDGREWIGPGLPRRSAAPPPPSDLDRFLGRAGEWIGLAFGGAILAFGLIVLALLVLWAGVAIGGILGLIVGVWLALVLAAIIIGCLGL